MPFVRTLIDPAFDREWIAKAGGFVTHSRDLEPDGRWLYCADDPEAAAALIADYPARYLAGVQVPEALAKIDERAKAAFLAGFAVPDGPLAGHRLQLRNNEDRTNWLSSAVAYQAAIGLGAGDLPAQAHFRTAENVTVRCTYREGAAVLLKLQAWGAAIMARAWTLKDAAMAASSNEALQDLLTAELESGWPDA